MNTYTPLIETTDEMRIYERWLKSTPREFVTKITNEIYPNVTVSFPASKSNSRNLQVKLKGPKDAVEVAKRRILDELELFSLEVGIPEHNHAVILANVKRISNEFNVYLLAVPDIVLIRGFEDDCLKAKEALLKLECQKVPFPLEFHKQLLVRKTNLQKKYKVQIVVPCSNSAAHSFVTVSGSRENVEKTSEELSHLKDSLAAGGGRVCTVKMPIKLIEQLKSAGAHVDKSPDEAFYTVSMTYDDQAWRIYIEWVKSLDDEDSDPTVLAFFAPPAAILGTALCPTALQIIPILNESNSIIHHYRLFRKANFLVNPTPVIPGPIAGFLGFPFVHIRHATMTLSALVSRIQDPPPTYPTISGLGAGSYICHLQQTWQNVMLGCVLFKP